MKRIKRIISVLLVVSMLFTTNGISVFADSVSDAKTSSLPHKYLAPSNNQNGEGIDAEKGTVTDGENKNEGELNLDENPSEAEDNSSNNSENEDEETTTVDSTTIEKSTTEEESTAESLAETTLESTTETSVESSESSSETNTSESSDESTADTSSVTATTAKKEVVEEEKTATTSDAEDNKNIIENEISFEQATISEIKQTNLFGTDEASESETSLIHKYIDDNDKYLNYIDDNYEAPIADMSKSGLFGADPLPSKYDSREQTNTTTGLSYVPPVRYQNPYGTCWAFSSIGMIETSIRKKGYVSTEAASNLSELALAYFVYNLEHVTDRPDYDNLGISGHDYYYLNQEYFTDPDEATWSQCGGNLTYSTKMMSAYLGAVVEDSVTEYSSDGNKNQAMIDAENHGLPAEYAYKKNAFVPKDIIYINKSNEEAIKQAIMDNGSVGFSYYSEPNNERNPSTGVYEFKARAFHWEGDGDNKKSYYMSNGQTRTNHAIMIVGWDDTIPKEKFYYGGADPVEDGIDWETYQYKYKKPPTDEEYASATKKASRNGAWICRNSWSTHPMYLSKGYFYMSYDETSLSSTFYSIDAIPADTYKYNYHYDTTGAAYNMAPYGDNTQYANIFKVSGADDSQVLQAVNIGVDSTNSTYDIKIYTKNDGSPMAHPKDGTLAATKRCSNVFAGFYTFELDNDVMLTKDSYYSIVVEPVGSSVRLFVDMTDDYYGYFFTYNETKLGQSYFNSKNYGDDDWLDLNDPEVQASITYYPAKEIDGKLYGNNWRIKALTNPYSAAPAPTEGYYVLTKDWFDGSSTGISKDVVESITFLKYNEVVPTGADVTEWDLPSGTHGLKGYTKGNDIYIYAPANVPIKLPVDSSFLFSANNLSKVNYTDNEHLTNRDKFMDGPIPTDSNPPIYFDALKNINGLNNLTTEDVTDMQGMFYNCIALESADFSNFNTSNVTDMSLMFNSSFADGIACLDLSSFDTSNVTSFNRTFEGIGVREINTSSFDTSSAINMAAMFASWDDPSRLGIEKLDLSNFNTSNVVLLIHMISAHNVASVSVASFDTRNVQSFEGLFYDMPQLTEIDISNFDTTSATDMRWMFNNCPNLRIIKASNKFVAKGITTNMFDLCTSLVGGKGTTYSESNPKDGTYARIDKGPTSSAPGYFTSAGSVTVTFDYAGKGTNYSESYERGETINKPLDPTYDGYTFVHWYREGTSDTSPYDFTVPISSTSPLTIKLIAKWNVNQYQVNYNLSGISATAPSSPITKTYGSPLALGVLKNPTNIPTGYTFAGWYKESTFVNQWTGADDLTTGTTAQTIYARWKAKITYNANGHGTAPASVDVYLNDSTVLPSITNVTGYTFDTTNSWYDGADTSTATLIGASGSDYTVTVPKELFAKWNEEEYTITYDRKDGNWTGTAPASSRKYSEEVTLPVAADIAKNDGVNDYVFKGWYTEDGSSSTWDDTKKVTKINANTVAPAGGHMFYARWNPAWKITFNMLGHGSAPSDIVAEQGTKVPTSDIPANPTEMGYIFSGWYKNYDASVVDFDGRYTNPFNFSTDTVTANTLLYAKWKPITYTISYNANGGTVSPTSDTKTYATNLTLAVPTRTGYDFDAWYKNYDATTKTFSNPYDGASDISIVQGDAITVYAKWIAHQYTVDYDLVGVAATKPASTILKTYDSPLADGVLQNPTNIPSGYEFLGWFKSYDSTTGNYGDQWTGADDLTTGTTTQTIYAKWKRAIVYNVLMNGVDIGATAVPSKEITGETTYNLPSTSATGYTFGGWYGEAACTTFKGNAGDPITVSVPTTLYAKWTPVSYKIYYKNVDGSSITDGEYVTKTYGTTVTLNTTPTKTGYVFNGWFTDNTSFNNSYDGTTDIASTQGDDKNIYAKWVANQYQVNYNLSGIAATAPSTPVTKTYGQALAAGTLKNPTNIPTGYTFAGWYKESTFANEWTGADDLTTGTTAQTIYARWKAKITYNANGHGTTPAAVDVLLNTTTVLPSIADVTGYTFDTTNSWYDGADTSTATLIGAASSNYTVTVPKELFAKWNEEEYTITYDRKDGNWTGTAPASSRKYSEEVTLPVAADIAKNDGVNDYVFKGWYTVDGSSSTWDEIKKVTKINANTVAPAGGHMFYARWNPAWKITFNMLGHATAPSDIVAEQGTKVPTADIPANPSDTGYIFSGWYKNYDSTVADFDGRYTNPFNFSTDTVTANMTLYAKWKPISYTIRYNANGGTVSPTSDTKVYDANLTLAVPTRTGYDFDAWYQNYDSTTDTFTNPYDGTTNISTTNGDTKDVYAKWIAHQYTVDYNLGTEASSAGAVAPTSTITKTYGKDLTAGELQNPSVIPNGYEFLGWYKEATFDHQWTGNDDLTSDNGVTVYIYAKWKRAVVFSVLYQGNDIGASVPASVEITGPTDINLPSTSATGYTFGGWYREPELTNLVGDAGDPVNVSVPTTFYAKWTPVQYDITYNALGGNLPGATTNPFTKTYGVATTLVNPTYEGYDFDGWYANYNSTTKAYSNPYDGSTDISTDTTGKTIYAKWNPHKYNINYELSGHATAMTPYEKTYGVSYNPPTPAGIAAGYKFDGWFKESTFTTAYTGDDLTTGTDPQTIYARWKATVTYDANGHGTAPAAVDVILGQTTVLPSIANVTGYTFDTTNSWYDGSDTSAATLIGAAGSNYTVNAPKKVYAKWNENDHTITYDKDGGDWVAYDPVTAGDTTRKYSEEKPLPGTLKIAKTGYTFLGWYKQGDTTKTVITKINANTDEDITVIAKWSENTYNITLNRNGGNYVAGYTAPSSRKYTESKPLPTNDDIKKTGYRLDGWYEQSDYSGTAVTQVAENTDEHKTFYAKWVPETYAVTLHVNGGTINSGNVTSYTYGTGAPLPTDVTKANSVFKGWWTLDGTTSGTWGSEVTSISATETGIKDYYAKWAESYVVTFNLVSGTTHPELANITNVPTSQNIESGNVAVRPQVNPQAENYEFVGWYDDTLTNAFNFNTPITATTTIYAKWNSVATYEVTFNLVSGTTPHPAATAITGAPGAQHIVNGRTVTKPTDPTATGYRFVAWYTDDTFATEWNFTSNTITEPKTIYGKWGEVSYNIIYHENGGSYISTYTKPTSRNYTESKTLPSSAEISKHGYTFGGWYESDIYEGSAITEVAANTARDVTVYAKWTPTANTKIITFNDNYSGATAEQAFILGEDSSIRTNVFTRSGYTFIRWKDSAGNVYLNTNQLTGDIVLYAEWQKNPTPPPSNDNGNSSSNSSSDSGSSRGAGPIPQNQQHQPTNNQQGTARQVEVSTSKSDQIVVSGNTAAWAYDPVNNSWKLSAIDLGGVPTTAKNGFFILSQVIVAVENNQAVAKTINDTYYFDQQGNMVTGWVKTNDSKWYFFNNEKTLDEGKLCIGWKKIDGAWYFFSSNDGSMATNTTTSDGYKVGADGKWIQ